MHLAMHVTIWVLILLTLFPKEEPRNRRSRRWKSQRKPRVGFKDLSTEIALEIGTYLSEIDYLCLALTCKSLMNILDGSKTLQRSPKFRESTENPLFWPNRIFYRFQSRHDRGELLQRLEDSRWRLCNGCFKLHPINEFSLQDLKTSNLKRTCVYGPLVGVVRLCPCTEMTFRDKSKLVKKLSSCRQAQVLGFKTCSPVLDSVVFIGRHQCSHLYDSGQAKVQCKLKLILEEDQNFVVETKYTVAGTDLPNNLLQNIVLLCPHRRIDDQISDLIKQNMPVEITHGRHWRSSNYSMTCPKCQTTTFNARWCIEPSNNTEDICSFTTRRCFGKAIDEADDIWYQQTETAFQAQFLDHQFYERYRPRPRART